MCFPLVSNFWRTSHPYYTVETFKHNPPTYASSILLQEYPTSCVFDTVYWEQEPPASLSGEAALAYPHMATHLLSPVSPTTPRGDSHPARCSTPKAMLRSPRSPVRCARGQVGDAESSADFFEADADFYALAQLLKIIAVFFLSS